MFFLPPDIQARIYEFDGTFHEVWQRVLREGRLSLVMKAHDLDLAYTVRNYMDDARTEVQMFVVWDPSSLRYLRGGRALRINEKGRRCFGSGPL